MKDLLDLALTSLFVGTMIYCTYGSYQYLWMIRTKEPHFFIFERLQLYVLRILFGKTNAEKARNRLLAEKMKTAKNFLGFFSGIVMVAISIGGIVLLLHN
jgi:hypothetical protein